MINLFHIIDDAQVILRSKGKFYQAKVYRRGNRLFAGVGNAFVRLGGGDATSFPSLSYEDLNLPEHIQIERGPTGEPMLVAPIGNGQPLKVAA